MNNARKKKAFFLSGMMFCLYLFTTLVFSADARFTQYSNLTGLALAIVFATETIFIGKTRQVFDRLLQLWPMLIFVILVTISSLTTGNGMTHPKTMFQIFVLFGIAYSLCTVTKKTWFIEYGLLLGLAYIWYTGAWRGGGGELSRFRFEVSEAKGGQLNPNVYSLYLCAYVLMAMRFVLIVYPNLKKSNTGFLRVLVASIGSLLSVYEVFVRAGSRKGMMIMGLVALGALIIVFRPELNVRKKFSFRKLIVGGLFVVALIYVGNKAIDSSRFADRMSRLVEYINGDSKGDASIRGREYLIEKGMEWFASSPIVGIGTQGFAKRNGVYSHSNVVEILCNHGLIGFLFYYLLSIQVLFKLIPKVFGGNKPGRDEAIWVSILVVSLLTYELFAVTYYTMVIMVLLSVAVGFGFHPSPVQQERAPRYLWYTPRVPDHRSANPYSRT